MNPLPSQPDNTLRLLAAIVDSSEDAIFSKDLNSVVMSWNAAAERIFGYRAEEMVGQSGLKLIPPGRQDEEEQILARIRRGERIEHFETVRLRKDGSPLAVSLTISPIKDETGAVVGSSKIAHDITGRIAIEEARREIARERQQLLEDEQAARTDAERMNRVKDEFLATLSHELRTPLNAILGWAAILRSGTAKAATARQGLDAIDRNARAQARIIEDLLDLSRIISGKVRLDVQKVDLADVLEASMATVQAAAQAKGVRLHATLDPSMAPVSGDPGRLQQVFWNLLINAVKFTPRGGRVHVVLERVNSHAEVSVADTGEGIAPENLDLIFDRFQQVDSSRSRRHGGLGIGLALVRQLVELHGGRVRARSGGLGRGTTFVAQFPLSACLPGREETGRRHPAAAADAAPALPADISLAGVRVLVVDDERDAREILRHLLQSAGGAVTAAASAAEAMDILAGGGIDIIICDIGMPGEDGYSFLHRVRARGHSAESEVPAVALTAYARAEDRTTAIRAGFQNHLTKPVEPGELLAVVQSLTKPRSARKPGD